jgi:hypothetical protein
MQSSWRSLVVCCIVGVSALGCGVAYSHNQARMLREAADSDFGPPPPDDHNKLEEQSILSTLRDPESARFEFGPVVKGTIPKGFASPTPILVWITSVRVNAKNGFGGYTGFKKYGFAWRDGVIIAVGDPDCDGCNWAYTKK